MYIIIYRSKPKTKEIHKKPDQDQLELIQQHKVIQQSAMPVQQQATICPIPQSPIISHKVNVLQNISLQPIKDEAVDPEDATGTTCPKPPETIPNLAVCNENQAPKPKLIANVKPSANITLKQTICQPPGPSGEAPKSIKMCSSKKPITKTVNSGQKLIVVSNAQTIQPNSILQRTLQLPFMKNVSIKNLEKFKIVTSNSAPTNLQVTHVTNSGVNSVKHKVVTVKTNPTTKKVIPFSQLQVLNSKGNIKVLPLGGKIVGKGMTTASPLYFMTTQGFTKGTSSSPAITTSKLQTSIAEDVKPVILEKGTESTESTTRENGKSSVLEDILKASGVISEECIAEDYDTKIEEFHIPQNKIKELGIGAEMEIVTRDVKEEVSIADAIKTEVQSYEYDIMQVKDNLEITGVEEMSE
ncbi:hypothetical protein NQ317_001234 [Molorchus minor]|uniref:Uncharacterized protein n=1 Tax=Molorchus minor TaxID=1323400 RepID=A0ABQ9JD33_9CUCU|nr:hypothetical protein NQ317_001234 [Molorchus minor]